jgi:GMP synthase (glutamine-hydrolysing)
VHGVFVDTGFMRQDEPREVMQAFELAGFHHVEKREAANSFLTAISELHGPEEKRKAIGLTFLAVENEVLATLPPDEWMLGQGTIYPDTIESGGSREAALIKTHHNRVPELTKRLEAGLVVEPLAQFYKDEVRQIGRALGLPSVLIEKQPFPGPGLAVRYLCCDKSLNWRDPEGLDDIAKRYEMRGRALPLRAVGVQGDGRTYAYVAVLVGDYRSDVIGTVSKEITNTVPDVNRVAYWIDGKAGPESFRVEPESIAVDGLSLLKSADAIVREVLAHDSGGAKIWQCPVILLPLKYQGLRTVAIRPVESVDGMTAQYAKLPKRVLMTLAVKLLTLSGIGAVLYDVTNKPPATIEWE